MNKLISDNLKTMKKIAKKKFGYGISQTKEEFDPAYNISNDKKAMAGKRILKNLEHKEK